MRYTKGSRIRTLNPVSVFEPGHDAPTTVARGTLGTVTSTDRQRVYATFDGISGGPYGLRRWYIRKIKTGRLTLIGRDGGPIEEADVV